MAKITAMVAAGFTATMATVNYTVKGGGALFKGKCKLYCAWTGSRCRCIVPYFNGRIRTFQSSSHAALSRGLTGAFQCKARLRWFLMGLIDARTMFLASIFLRSSMVYLRSFIAQ